MLKCQIKKKNFCLSLLYIYTLVCMYTLGRSYLEAEVYCWLHEYNWVYANKTSICVNKTSISANIMGLHSTFDRVNLLTLFNKLHSKGMCPVYLKTLIHLYRTQSLRINWNGCTSSEFAVSNGVKQGAMLSPLLFAV